MKIRCFCIRKVVILLFTCVLFRCTRVDTVLKIEDLLSNTDITLEMIDTLVQRYSDYDEDYKKIKNRTLFDDWPDLKAPYPQIYLIINNIEQGGKIADMYYKNKYHNNRIKRRQLQYKNMYIYYYENNDFDWNYVIIISIHTGEVLYEQMK